MDDLAFKQLEKENNMQIFKKQLSNQNLCRE